MNEIPSFSVPLAVLPEIFPWIARWPTVGESPIIPENDGLLIENDPVGRQRRLALDPAALERDERGAGHIDLAGGELTTSLPAPQTIRSEPGPPVSTSFPGPALSVSLPPSP